MAAITSSQVVRSFVYPGVASGEKVVVMQINTVTDADTIDVSTVGPVAFKKVKCATALSQGSISAIGTCTPVATTITIALTGAARHTIWIMVIGPGPNA